ncbi:hypothetical protein KGF57_002821 [Candida theae]|uniref:Uncharacterized protein n=1 Tax=Candida theae TaxID=1198502 RepID=A0AAD5BE77_9ASCO|nr:uncharacterized protein KGF57_002821 [Candida theae]KAI5958013.1 hypothetical protein KGF57_002821 [Candida theae]
MSHNANPAGLVLRCKVWEKLVGGDNLTLQLMMDVTSKDEWCTCEPIYEDEAVIVEGHGSYPPRAGQGFRRSSTDSESSHSSSTK